MDSPSWGVQGQATWGSEKCGLVEGVPGHDWGSLICIPTQTLLWVYDSMSLSSPTANLLHCYFRNSLGDEIGNEIILPGNFFFFFSPLDKIHQENRAKSRHLPIESKSAHYSGSGWEGVNFLPSSPYSGLHVWLKWCWQRSSILSVTEQSLHNISVFLTFFHLRVGCEWARGWERTQAEQLTHSWQLHQW